MTNLRGEVICSNVDGGGVVKLMDGTARGEGACESAAAELCEYVLGGR